MIQKGHIYWWFCQSVGDRWGCISGIDSWFSWVVLAGGRTYRLSWNVKWSIWAKSKILRTSLYLLNRVAKCQFFITEQNPQTKFYISYANVPKIGLIWPNCVFSQTFYPNLQIFLYTDISVISVTFRNSAFKICD